MKTRKGEPVIVVPEEQQQLVELEQELATERKEHLETWKRLKQAEVELRRWRGCPSCKEDHDDNVMCPPHEVRTSGRAWFDIQARKWAERAEELQVERDELKRKLDACQCETKVLNESMLIEARQERANWQKTARQAYRDGGYYRGLVVSIGELFGQEARTSDDGSIQDDVLCAKVPELCTAMRGERDQLAAEVVQLGSLRPEVLAFASVMEYVLQNNDDKGGWKDCDPEWLLGRLEDEVRELREVLRVNLNRAFRNETEIRYEAADVANFAMMIADVCGALAATPHAAKAAERVRKLEEAVQVARELTVNFESRTYRAPHHGDGWEAIKHEVHLRDQLRDALDRLDATGVAEGDSDATQR